jgi:serine/threonine protein kinase
VFLENRQGDSIVSHMTGANKTVATQATHFKEDSPSGGLFSDFYKKGDKLGQGGFSTVYRCLHKRTSLSYAVKEVDIANLSGQEICTLQDEIVVLKFLRGAPFIIRLYDVFREANKTYMVLEEMKGGDVLHRICEKEVYTEREARDLCKILFHAVDYCHKKHIAHRDIKLDNLLLTVS